MPKFTQLEMQQSRLLRKEGRKRKDWKEREIKNFASNLPVKVLLVVSHRTFYWLRKIRASLGSQIKKS